MSVKAFSAANIDASPTAVGLVCIASAEHRWRWWWCRKVLGEKKEREERTEEEEEEAKAVGTIAR